jgi:hypothetical protein
MLRYAFKNLDYNSRRWICFVLGGGPVVYRLSGASSIRPFAVVENNAMRGFVVGGRWR